MLKKADIGVGLYLLCAVVFFIVPIPSLLLDVMLAFNIALALIILFNVLFVKEVLDMSFFPTLCTPPFSQIHKFTHKRVWIKTAL